MNKPRLKGLGRGLDALLAANQEEEADKGELQSLPTIALQPGKYQPRTRMDPGSLEELAASIKAQGVMQPIMVRPVGEDAYEIIAGERRWRASQIAGLAEVPCLVREIPDEAALAMSLIENIQREDLNAWEVAISYGRLADEFKLSHESISDRVGKKRSTVTNYIRLLKFEGDDDIKHGIIEGKISMGHARALAGIEDNHAFRKVLFNRVLVEDLSVRAVEEAIAEYHESRKPKAPKEAKNVPQFLRDIEDRFNAFFGGKVQLKRDDKGKGQIVVKFKNDAELNRLLDAIEHGNG